MLLLTVLVTFLACEVFIRTANIGSVSATEFYEDIGRGRRANLDYIYFNEGFGLNRFNEYRYIGESHPPAKENNTKRIVLLGDSYVESFQIFDRDYFGNLAENTLNSKQSDTIYQVLNFGRSGFDLGDIYAYQKTFAEKFHPDLIVYMLSAEDLTLKYSDPLRPKTVLIHDTLTVSFDFPASEIRAFEKTKFLTQNSGIITMINNGRKKVNKIPLASILLDKIYYWFNPIPEENYKDRGEAPLGPVTKSIITNLDPSRTLIINRDTIPLPASFVELCKINNIRYLDLSIPLNEMKNEGVNPNYWKVTNRIGHWNHEAHRRIGKVIADYVYSNNM